VLDLGAGTGRDALPFLGRECGVTAFELAPRLAERLRAARSPGGQHIDVMERDLLDACPPSESFDLAVCSFVLHYLPRQDATAVLRTLQQAVRPAGLALLRLFVATGELCFKPDAFLPEDGEVEELFAGWRVVHCQTEPVVTAERHPDHDAPKRHVRTEWLLVKPALGAAWEHAVRTASERCGSDLRFLFRGEGVRGQER
jgi:SAM-dependent methyltransferase